MKFMTIFLVARTTVVRNSGAISAQTLTKPSVTACKPINLMFVTPNSPIATLLPLSSTCAVLSIAPLRSADQAGTSSDPPQLALRMLIQPEVKTFLADEHGLGE